MTTIQDIKLFEVDLPQPSKELIAIATEFLGSRARHLKQQHTDSVNALFDNKVDCVKHAFGHQLESVELSRQLRKEYSRFFPGMEICSHYAIMAGDYEQTGLLKTEPPHVDSYRNINLNFYIDLGGDDVETWFYHMKEPKEGKVYYTHDEIEPLGHCKFDLGKWYLFDPLECHSVEKVKGPRAFFSIVFLDVNSYKVQQYNDPRHTQKVMKFFDGNGFPYKFQDVVDKLNEVKVKLTPVKLAPI